MKIDREQIEQITSNVWGLLVSVPAEPVDVIEANAEKELLAYVDISGDISSRVYLRCGYEHIQDAACGIFEQTATDIQEQAVHDVICELANMVAGNFKAMMPGETQLSLPEVETAPEKIHQMLDQEFAETINMRAGDNFFSVYICEAPKIQQ